MSDTKQPMTFEQWYLQHFDEDYDCEDSTSINLVERERIKATWQAATAHQSDVIASMQSTIDAYKALKMPNEDVLLDLYKIHAYIPFDADNNPLTPYGNFTQGFGVAFSMFEAIAKVKAMQDKDVKC